MDMKKSALIIQTELKTRGITVTWEQVYERLQLFAKFKVTGYEAKRGVIHAIEEASGITHKKPKMRWKSKEEKNEYLRKEACDGIWDYESKKHYNKYKVINNQDETEFFESNKSCAGDYDIMQYYCKEEVEPMVENLKEFFYIDKYITQAEYEAKFCRYPWKNINKEEFSCEASMINPQYAEMYDKGTALAKMKRYDEAIKVFDEALKINSQDVEMWYNKGYALERYGRNIEANKAFDEALKINSLGADMWYNKGNALENLGRNDEANKAFEKALELHKINRSLK